MKVFGFNITRKTLAGFAAWARGDDLDGGGAVLHNAYQQLAWVYAAINVLAQQVANIPFLFSSGERGRETLISSGPLLDFYAHPHPQIDRFQYWELRVIWLMLRGECFRIPIYDDLAKRRLSKILILDPAQFQEIIDGNQLVGWRYTGFGLRVPLSSQIFLPSEVWHEKLPNPFDFWRGMSPLSVAAVATQTDFAASAFMKGLMENNADTGVIVRTDQQLAPDQREQLLSALKDRKRKAGTADRPLLLWGGAEVVKPTLSSTDMQFLENRKFSRAEICAVFGVPEEIITAADGAKYDVMAGARLNFIENRVAPLCARLEAAEQWAVQTLDPRAVGWFDLDALPIMQQARRSRWATAKTGFDMGYPVNQLNKIFDLGADDLAWGDIGFLPFSLQPADQVATPPPEPAPPQANALERTVDFFDRLTPHTCATPPDYESQISPSIKLKTSKLLRFWFEQRNRVLSKLPDVMREFVLDGAKGWRWKDADPLSRGLDDAFDAAAESVRLAKALKPLLIGDLNSAGAQLWKEINLDPDTFKLPPNDAIKFLDARNPAIAGINQTTWDRLKSSLQEGLAKGEPMDELTDRVKTFFAGQDARAEVIAETETNVAINSGRHLAMVQAKVPRKGWQTSHLENTRLTHLANEQLSNEQHGIPIDDPWPNGLMHPGDPDGDPGEVINCRCFGYAVLETQEAPHA